MINLDTLKFQLRQELGRMRRRLVPVPLPDDPTVRLHLGCGAIDQPGFINIDGIDRPHVHYVQGIDLLPRFRSESVDFIYTSHTLEHFPWSATNSVLSEWFRILRPGGTLAVSVPDFDRILEVYKLDENNLNSVLPPLFGGQDYPFNFHYTAFNEKSLTSAMTEVGFRQVVRWQHGSDPWHSLPDWSGRQIKFAGQSVPISLNLEATK